MHGSRLVDRSGLQSPGLYRILRMETNTRRKGRGYTGVIDKGEMKMTEEEDKNERTKKTGTAVWLGLAVLLISASTSGCMAYLRWGVF